MFFVPYDNRHMYDDVATNEKSLRTQQAHSEDARDEVKGQVVVASHHKSSIM